VSGVPPEITVAISPIGTFSKSFAHASHKHLLEARAITSYTELRWGIGIMASAL
jgi:hypothetical protein